MDLTVSVADEVVRRAQSRAEAMGTSVDELVRGYLEQLGQGNGKVDHSALADEFERLCREAKGDSRGWKFNREEIHERR